MAVLKKVKGGWRSWSASRRPEGVVGDDFALEAEIFVKRRLLHGQRAYLRAMTMVRGTEEPPNDPIFIIGCPRSGTTLLFRLLSRHESLGSVRGEGHIFWNTYQHPRRYGWTSDRATESDIKPGESRYIYSAIRETTGGGRFLEKTPRNCLRIPYLAALFPNARFVLLKRSGLDTVSSLIEGWRVRHGISYRLPEPLALDEYQGNFWSYLLPPGWRNVAHTSIAEVAALQYVSSYETALNDLALLDEEKVTELSFEELLAEPVLHSEGLLDALGLKPSASVMAMATNLTAHPVQTNSPPRPDKWRERASEIAPVLDRIAPTMERLGYDVPVRL